MRGGNVNISYWPPLTAAWNRARVLLFRPFNLGFWFVLGFTAWIASLAGGHGSGGSIDLGLRPGRGARALEGAAATIQHLQREAGILALVLFAGLAGLAAVVVLLWVGSRGKFMFLDNVVHGRSRVTGPWHRFSRLGDSLFLWRLVFLIAVMLVILAIVIPLVITSGIMATLRVSSLFAGGAVLTLVGMLLIVLIPVSYVILFLDDFVVPMMYRYNLTATAAWGMFLGLFREQPGYFLLYGIVVLAGWIAVMAAAAALGIATCCVGLVLLAIPYVGTVALLPVHVTYRSYSLEFLAQFGERYRVLGPLPAGPDLGLGPPPAGPASPGPAAAGLPPGGPPPDPPPAPGGTPVQ